jgi:Holliday junction resolvase YEN1
LHTNPSLSPGGANPAIRTLFYRLVRLLGLAIHPIFVFDGPNKPAFKRNKRSSGRGDAVATAMAKRLIRLFGFAIHDAPGEAEAECALLEQQGVVDAVLSEDVDTIMFGCRRTLRNWSAEGPRGSKTPTHVSMYDAGVVAAGSSGLDREGMVLVALMSGGDYLPEGVPGCGVKVACEAARAGFGRDLCRIKKADRDGLAAWKARLLHELRTNESGFFRTRHKVLEIPESFPNMEILRYYTHPVVSREATIERLKNGFPPTSAVDVVGLREFTRETFDWTFRNGAVKLTRVLASSLLVQRLLERSVSQELQHDDLDSKQRVESALIKAISNSRAHFSTDATPELRISFVPADIVKLDLDAEPEEEVEAFGRSGIALNSDDEFDDEAAEELGGEQSKSSSAKNPFDPFQPELVWIPETVAKLGIPLSVEDWESKQRLKEQRAAAKGPRKTRAKQTDMPVGALDKYVKVTKPSTGSIAKEPPRLDLASSPPRLSIQHNPPAPKGRSKQSKKTSTSSQVKPPADVNPWTLACSQASPRAAKTLASSASQVQPKHSSAREAILIPSSPVAPTSPSTGGAGVKPYQTTPTKPKRTSPLLEDIPSPPPLFSPSPSSRKQRFPVSEEPAEEKPVTEKPQAVREARSYKRVKSGAEDAIISSSMQKSIKGFGRVLKNANSSQDTTKPDASDSQPIEILSDDEDIPPPPVKQQSASSIFCRNTGPSTQGRGLDIASDDDDPFASPPPARRCTPAAQFQPEPACAPASTSKTKPEEGQRQPAADNQHAPNDTPMSSTAQAAVTAALSVTAKSATTKVYIQRESLGGHGFFSEVEVSRDEADKVLAAHNSGNGSSQKGGKRAGRKAWRLSEVEVLDLTGED